MGIWLRVAAALVVAGGVAVALDTVPGRGTAAPSLPGRIGAPSVFSGTSPIGSASVAF